MQNISVASVLDQSFYDQIDWLALTLKRRGLGDKHYKTGSDLARRIDALPNKLDLKVNIPSIPSGIMTAANFYQLYFDPTRDDRDPYLQLCKSVFAMDRAFIAYDELWHPLLVHARHVPFRHIQRSSNVFGLEERTFLGLMAIAFVKVLEKMPQLQSGLESQGGLDIIIANTYGIYNCQARRMAENNPDAYVFMRRANKQGNYHIADVRPAWVPSIKILANTFRAQADMNSAQDKVFKAFQPLLNDERFMQGIMALAAVYVHPEISPDQKKAYGINPCAGLDSYAEEKLMAFLSQPEWQPIFTNSTEHRRNFAAIESAKRPAATLQCMQDVYSGKADEASRPLLPGLGGSPSPSAAVVAHFLPAPTKGVG